MKKIILLAALAVMLFASCSPRLVTTSTRLGYKGMKPVSVTDVVADLEVSSTKINFVYVPSKSVNRVGLNNVISTAVREALLSNGNADVLVGLETQTKFNHKGKVESIAISGYPAKYVNFRSVDAEYILEMSKLYMDLNLKLNYNPGSEPVPNLIPDIRPDLKSKSKDDGKAGIPLIGKLERRKK